MSDSHITRYDVMPIPPIEAHTEWFEAGVLRIGVEYRLLTDAIAVTTPVDAASGDVSSKNMHFDDCGVALHVCGENDGVMREWLRFDCFAEDPHYHYVSWDVPANEVLPLAPRAAGARGAWRLPRGPPRRPPRRPRAAPTQLAARVDSGALEAALPRIAEAAYRVRYHHDDDQTLAGALAGDGS